ncbi:hydroxyisourate hydrolase [Vibrio sp. SS-MA-C1-2]|uniref:hydroxyisourate hydrolase n=1 Tax=Vibrio sp. SS-MA-C1-2 TaxID=2908646 RepID=UPI001F1DD06D|nr:hydroxyisourate hydrolase [Vibrio sp. SS-MA-C1-2]UJF17834.1 hydroxyisourate hydrolase [Vibrio sp. SS-MA-C1-2]
MSGYLTTHVLDTAQGLPGEEITVSLYAFESGEYKLITKTVTNSDGRTDTPILSGAEFKKGKYQLVFEVAAYFEKSQKPGAADNVPFLDDVVLRFGINDEQAHYHVPLLVSPYSFSTYRGS